jgi:hypothetical protein
MLPSEVSATVVGSSGTSPPLPGGTLSTCAACTTLPPPLPPPPGEPPPEIAANPRRHTRSVPSPAAETATSCACDVANARTPPVCPHSACTADKSAARQVCTKPEAEAVKTSVPSRDKSPHVRGPSPGVATAPALMLVDHVAAPPPALPRAAAAAAVAPGEPPLLTVVIKCSLKEPSTPVEKARPPSRDAAVQVTAPPGCVPSGASPRSAPSVSDVTRRAPSTPPVTQHGVPSASWSSASAETPPRWRLGTVTTAVPSATRHTWVARHRRGGGSVGEVRGRECVRRGRRGGDPPRCPLV